MAIENENFRSIEEKYKEKGSRIQKILILRVGIFLGIFMTAIIAQEDPNDSIINNLSPSVISVIVIIFLIGIIVLYLIDISKNYNRRYLEIQAQIEIDKLK